MPAPFVRDAPTGFRLTVPRDWTEFDLTGAQLAALRRSMKDRVPPGSRHSADSLMKKLAAMGDHARKHGAKFAAGTAAVYDDGLFLAQAMVFSLRPPGGDARSLLSGLTSKPGRELGTLDIPEVGEVPRVRGTEDIAVGDDAKVRAVVTHTFIPVPDADNVLVVSCASPNLPHKDALLTLFETVTATFRWEH